MDTALDQATEQTAPEMKYHPDTDIFPPMEPADFDALVADITHHGLTEEIWTMPDMVTILDGKHRYRACLKTGVKPRFRVWNGAEYQTPKEFVLSENLHRRHLTASQRAAFAIDLLPQLKEQAKDRMRSGGGDKKSGTEIVSDPIMDPGEAVQKAADLAKTNPTYVRSAEQIAREAPDLINDVQNGKLTIPAAKKKLGARKKSAARGRSATPECRKKTPAGDLGISDDLREVADLAYDSLRNDGLSVAEVVRALVAIIKLSGPAMNAIATVHSNAGLASEEFLESKLRELFGARP